MEVVNKKDGNKNFMIIKGIEIDENDYKFKMLKNNNIENVIPIGLRVIDGEKQLYYNVTEYITVKAMFSRKKMSGKDLYNLIKDIKKLSKSTKEYLMDLNDFLFDINYVYINKKSGEYGFCYCPNEYEDVQQNMRNIFDSILECIDHNNKPAVLMAYGIQQITISDSYTVQDLYNCAVENYKEAKESTYKKKDREEFVKGVENIVINTEKNVVTKPYEEKKKSLFKKIMERLKGKNKYEDEDELEAELENPSEINKKESGLKEISGQATEGPLYNYSDYQMATIGEETDNYRDNYEKGYDDNYDGDYEEATMLLTSSGVINRITLKEISNQGSMKIEPKGYPCILGKSKLSSDYIVDSPVVSRVHLRLSEEMSNYYVEDLNSTNGTYVNGQKLEPHKPKEINVEDQITVADIDFIVE